MNNAARSEHQRKGLTISITFHASLLLLAIIPLIVNSPDEPELENAIVIDFQDFSSKSSGGSAAAAPRKSAPRSQVALQKLDAATAMANPISKPNFRPVITSEGPGCQGCRIERDFLRAITESVRSSRGSQYRAYGEPNSSTKCLRRLGGEP